MDSREKILSTIKKNQPPGQALPEINVGNGITNTFDKFADTLTGIGGTVVNVESYDEILDFVSVNYSGKRVISTLGQLSSKLGVSFEKAPQLLENVTLTILPAQFAVAENGAIWLTDTQMGDRALPYITEHLALVLERSCLVPTLHEAYDRIGNQNYDLGTFIAGPSKTADIEQSLVLGAHGAKSLVVFVIG